VGCVNDYFRSVCDANWRITNSAHCHSTAVTARDTVEGEGEYTMRLTVKRLREENVREGLAAIDLATMSQLGVLSGEHVEVDGTDGTVRPRVWPAYDDESRVIRVGETQRRTLGVDLDGTVEVEPATVSDAEALLVGVPTGNDLTESFARTIRDHLIDCVVEPGDTLRTPVDLDAGTRRISVRIYGTNPDAPVTVNDETALKVRTYDSDESEANGDTTYADVGGLDDALARVRELVELQVRDPSPFDRLGVDPPTGILLHGPPGTGKTLLAEAVANETPGVSLHSLSGPEVVSRYYGESEQRLRDVFERARESSPAVLFVDELDAIAPARDEATGDVERRIVTQLLTLMDGVDSGDDVVVVGATNRREAIDPALRRGGRFDREVAVPIPDRDDRLDVLRTHTREMPLADDVDLAACADETHGFVGADLASLTREATMRAVDRAGDEIDAVGSDQSTGTAVARELSVCDADFQAALAAVDPSALREASVDVPDASWSEVGGLADVKRSLREAVEWPLAYPDVLDAAGLESGQGVLLYGPPGTGKTLLARVVASESDCNLLSVDGPELLSKWVGESERRVRELFERARNTAPTVVLFDEIDAIAAERNRSTGSDVGDRVVGQLLTELDGIERMEDVVVVATTNRPDLVDDALCRPGRLDREIHVPPPDCDARREILSIHAADSPIAPDVDFDYLARETEGYVGADIAAVCRHAATLATRAYIGADGEGSVTVTVAHFEAALDAVDPSVEDGSGRHYARETPETGRGRRQEELGFE